MRKRQATTKQQQNFYTDLPVTSGDGYPSLALSRSRIGDDERHAGADTAGGRRSTRGYVLREVIQSRTSAADVEHGRILRGCLRASQIDRRERRGAATGTVQQLYFDILGRAVIGQVARGVIDVSTIEIGRDRVHARGAARYRDVETGSAAHLSGRR